jgi:hypothetical protein
VEEINEKDLEKIVKEIFEEIVRIRSDREIKKVR